MFWGWVFFLRFLGRSHKETKFKQDVIFLRNFPFNTRNILITKWFAPYYLIVMIGIIFYADLIDIGGGVKRCCHEVIKRNHTEQTAKKRSWVDSDRVLPRGVLVGFAVYIHPEVKEEMAARLQIWTVLAQAKFKLVYQVNVTLPRAEGFYTVNN
jgi:hypothetical protein